MNRSDGFGSKKRFTVVLMLVLLMASVASLGACSSKQDEESIEEENETKKDRKKDKKKDKDKDADTNADLKELLKAKIEQGQNEPDDVVTSDPGDYRKAFSDFANRLESVKGMTAEYYTKAVDGEYGYKTDTTGVPMGCLGYTISDFDMDGVEELLTYETVDDTTIMFSMYEIDKEVSLADKYVISDDYTSSDGIDAFAFLYGYDGRIRIGYYSNAWMGYYADGEFVIFRGISYENGKFTEGGKGGYAGSDVWEDADFLGELRKSGINVAWEDLNEIGLLRATGGSRLFMIKVQTNDVEYETGEYGLPILLKKQIAFYGSSTLEEVEAEADRRAHELYIFPYSSERYLTEADLVGLSKEDLRRGRNEIVARHGRKFDDEELQAYFDSKPWYYGYIDPKDFNSELMLNEIEKENMEFIKQYEK